MSIMWESKSDQVFTLDLDKEFHPLSDYILTKKNADEFRVQFERGVFFGGEPHILIKQKNIPSDSELYISQRFTNVDSFFEILMAVDAAKRIGFQKLHLILPYFPAARQDRVCNEGEALTLKIFADLINQCSFDSVHILSPHSEVTPALINNVVVHDELKYVEEMIRLTCPKESLINIVCPDAGAGKRIQNITKYLSEKYPYIKINLIRCEKVRDVKTGEIIEFFVSSEDLGGHPTFIIDDILCYGGTFKGLGKIFKQRNCGKLYLFVSHCDCVAGVQNMVEFFDEVFTTNSKQDWDKYSYTMQDKVVCFNFRI